MVTSGTSARTSSSASHPLLAACEHEDDADAAEAISEVIGREVGADAVAPIRQVTGRVVVATWYAELSRERRDAALTEAARLALLAPREAVWRDFVQQWSRVAELDATAREVQRYLNFTA